MANEKQKQNALVGNKFDKIINVNTSATMTIMFNIT